MLKRVNRLPASVRLNNPKTSRTRFFLLKTGDNNLKTCRFAFIVSKKTAGKAVDRNRSKRLVRASVEKNLANIPAGKDYVFIIQENLIGIKFDEVDNAVKKTFLLK